MYGSARIGGKFVTWELGPGTNNRAEYLALIEALKVTHDVQLLNALTDRDMVIRMDSELVRNQVMGNWKVKNPDIRELVFQVRNILNDYFTSWRFEHISGAEMKRILGH
jgi:probable phosphoglycerate mutase